MSKKKKKTEKYSGINDHKRNKNKLITPLNELGMEAIQWERDLLPEYLWIELLSNMFPENIWPDLYNTFLDELDKYSPEGAILYGLISDFGLIPLNKREEFIKKERPTCL